MPLKTLVKVGCVTNLSDARYCAGMGVDLLGFRVIAGSNHYIDHTLFQQIRGWLSGPKMVAECYGISEKTNIAEIISQFAPDYIELNLREYLLFKDAFSLPFIVDISEADILPASEKFTNATYFITNKIELPESVPAGKPIIFKTHQKENVSSILSSNLFAGLALDGTAEIRPGFKTYDELADILEQLED
jgi:phosphoribosylanthranilate isomerase